MDSIIYNKSIEDDPIGLIDSLSIKGLLDLIKRLDISNASTVIVKK